MGRDVVTMLVGTARARELMTGSKSNVAIRVDSGEPKPDQLAWMGRARDGRR